MNCELCDFKNPKGTATAVIIKDSKLLLLKRHEEPFNGWWDFPGGYMQENESPKETIKREIKEELGVNIQTTYIKAFPGTASWKEEKFPVISHAFLADFDGEIKINEENSDHKWIPIKEIEKVAFDSNQDILNFIKNNFNFDFERVKQLVKQLDSSATINEQSLYKALLNGYISKIELNGKLVGFGWIFPRRTLLRKQAVIEDMIVDEKHRGKGLGKKILLDLLQWAKKNGIEIIELTSGSHRIAANELYKKVGFQVHQTNHYLLKL